MTSSPTENEAGDKEQVRSKSDFSIEHILNRAGNSACEKKTLENSGLSMVPLPWLHCTRYCPPKIPRNQKRDGPQKRQLGRHPRIPFTSQQLSVLEEKFRQTPYLSSTEVTKISRSLQLADIRVKIWFQNRRARERRERTQLETEQKLCTNTSLVPATSHCTTPQASPVSSSLEESPSSSSSTSTHLLLPSMIPLLQNCQAYQDIRNSPFLLNFPPVFLTDDSS